MRGFTREMAPAIIKLLDKIGNDGHTIWSSDILSDFPQLVPRFYKEHKSGLIPKDMIYGRNQIIPSLFGLYGLDILYAIANDLKVSYRPAIGRGTQARIITAAIIEALK